MPKKAFFIGPYNQGTETDRKPWLLPENAFESLENAFVWRELVRKRIGSRLFPTTYTDNAIPLGSRLRIALPSSEVALGGGAGVGITDGVGGAVGPTVPGTDYRVGQKFSIANEIFTVVEYGTPGTMTTTGTATTYTYDTTTGAYVFAGAAITTQIYFYPDGAGGGTTDGAGAAAGIVPGSIFEVGQAFSIGNEIFTVITSSGGTGPQALMSTGAGTGTFDTDTGQFTFTGASLNTQIYFYPADPVMGIHYYESEAINNESTIGFDTQFAYKRDGVGWDRLGLGAWSATDAQFFWACNYRGAANDDYTFFVVNHNRNDLIQYWTGGTWNAIQPQTRKTATGAALPANYTLQSARIILPFKDRLVCLNTLETVDNGAGTSQNASFTQRARWSWNRSPIFSTGAAISCLGSWYEEVPGVGGWADAPTKQAIISARILKDRLIVYFERSTWELVYTGNYATPFVWQTIDDSLGAESTFSSVLLDKVVFGVGQTGVHACDGLLVKRIDEQIPDFVNQLHNGNSGVERIAGVRDYFNEIAMWSYPDQISNPTFPNKILVYNYMNAAWAKFDDSITAFGYYQNNDDITWGGDTSVWSEDTGRWNEGTGQSLFQNIIAGNQEGFTFIMDRETSRNAAALQITEADTSAWPAVVITAINHNLSLDSYVILENAEGFTSGFNDIIYKVTEIVGEDDVAVEAQEDEVAPVGAYAGSGTIALVSIPYIKTKEYNFYPDAAMLKVNQVAFDVDKSSSGILTFDYFCDTNSEGMTEAAVSSDTILGDNIIEMYPLPTLPFEVNRSRLYREIYIHGYGECIQMVLSLRDEYIYTKEVVFAPFSINSMTFYAEGAGTRSSV